MNLGALGIIGIAVFVFVMGYLSESTIIMAIAAFIFLFGIICLVAKPAAGKNPATGKPYYQCPNCKKYAGEEIPAAKREDGKIYKCKLCGYKW